MTPAVFVQITNFQPIAQAILHLDGLTVIVGPSDRGKSALLRAIEGALFNKAGDTFVRKGASQTSVSLALGTETHIRWEKGKGINRFTIDGEVFNKVGKDAPEPLDALGFKDVLIGARVKDDGKLDGGEWVRPQVTDQLVPVFLLDRSGNFLYEVLARLSRLSVLQKATRLCMSDLHTEKSQYQQAKNSLALTTELLTRLEPIEPLRERLHLLDGRREALTIRQRQRDTLVSLARERRVRAAQAATIIPPKGPRTLPDLTVIQQLRALSPLRAKLTAVAALPFPGLRPALKRGLIEKVNVWSRLKSAAQERVMRVNALKLIERVAYQKALDHTEVVAQLERFKLEVGVCPTCGKPF